METNQYLEDAKKHFHNLAKQGKYLQVFSEIRWMTELSYDTYICKKLEDAVQDVSNMTKVKLDTYKEQVTFFIEKLKIKKYE